MKKTLKLVGIFVAILVVGFAGGLSVYYLIQSNKTYHIYDLRFVEPIAAAPTYIYMNSEAKYPTFKNQTVYMTSDKENMFEIAVYAYTSTNTQDLDIVSSNTDIAEIIYQNGKCFVKYKQAGKATITVSIDKVISDSFDVYVYNKPAEDFVVYDKTYYGKYAENFSNKVVAYADGLDTTYDYVCNSIFSDLDNSDINSSLLRVDASSVNSDVFESVSIDAKAKKLQLRCKASLSDKLVENQRTTLDESIVIQSYYYSKEGEIKVSKNYVVDVHIIADTPEFLQIVVANNPDFENAYVMMDTKDFSRATEEYIVANIDEFLSYQKAEQYLAENGEVSTYKSFFTEKVTEIYLKFRKVYTNGDIVYLNPETEVDVKEPNPYEFLQGEEYLTLSQNKQYYVLKLDKDDFGGAPINIQLYLEDFEDVNSTFLFEYKDFSAENVEDFYDYYAKTKTFVYTYWDLRTRYYNEICDAQGNVINFGGIDVDFSTLTPCDPPEEEPEEGTEEGDGESEEEEEGTA